MPPNKIDVTILLYAFQIIPDLKQKGKQLPLTIGSGWIEPYGNE